ncbi:MAG: DUF1573 domain-containing protein [Bacteroides sp.]|nr:DUF1573 domain-containing protein [Bacteroides sp.]MBD5274140.1 DUF1573 domain-containing protein [Bacteroides sp.]MDE6258262.1 DUF1573 domain-containing protein [Muribaculaceae bacterium]
MKKYLLMLLVAIIALIPGAAMAKDKGQSKITFTEKSHNFGIIKEDGGPVSYEFQFVNDGDGNLIVYEATAQCGCTKPEYPKSPVAPGKKGKIKVTYNPIGRPGPFEKTVTVKTNAKGGKARLKISGNVTPKGK